MSTVAGASTEAKIKEALLARRGVRVPLEVVWDLLFEHEPWWVGDAGADDRILEVLAAVEGDPRFRLPLRNYDTTRRIALPRSFTIVRDPVPQRKGRYQTYAWRPQLAWAAAASDIDEDDCALLERVQVFLREDGSTRCIIPVQERSLELFDDEKLLDALSRTRLFYPGRLTLDLLRCRAVAHPIHYHRIGDASSVLVAENLATWQSLIRTAPPDGPVGAIVWGQGMVFIASCLTLTTMPVDTIWYVGDIDARGLQIPSTADERLQRHGHGLRPAEPLYDALLAQGKQRPHAVVAPAQARIVTAWLAGQASRAAAVLEGGHRIAQEYLNEERLSAWAWWDELVRR